METELILCDTNVLPKLSGLNREESGKKRFTYPPKADDLGIVAFHRTSEMKCLQFLYRERKSLNLGFNIMVERRGADHQSPSENRVEKCFNSFDSFYGIIAGRTE